MCYVPFVPECPKEILTRDNPEQSVGLVDDRETIDIAVVVGQDRKQFVDIGFRADGDNIGSHHLTDWTTCVSRQIDAEIDRRQQQTQGEPAEEELSTLEERLKAEAKRYQKGGAAIRG